MLKGKAARTPAPQWVRVVGGWTEFQFAERRMPTLDEDQLFAAIFSRTKPLRNHQCHRSVEAGRQGVQMNERPGFRDSSAHLQIDP
jgi:predicted amidohydrolase YtcJ